MGSGRALGCNPKHRGHVVQGWTHLGLNPGSVTPQLGASPWSLFPSSGGCCDLQWANPCLGPGPGPGAQQCAQGEGLLSLRAPHPRLSRCPPPHTDGQWAVGRGSWRPRRTRRCGRSGGQLSWGVTAPRTAVQRGRRAPSGRTRAWTATRLRASVRMTRPCPTSSRPSRTTSARLGG